MTAFGALSPGSSKERQKGNGMRVLLIEDDSATAQSIELMLKSESFNVYTTDLGEEVSTSENSTITTSSCWI